jgi:hypothetical protein
MAVAWQREFYVARWAGNPQFLWKKLCKYYAAQRFQPLQ